jgi:hypothetical protein
MLNPVDAEAEGCRQRAKAQDGHPCRHPWADKPQFTHGEGQTISHKIEKAKPDAGCKQQPEAAYKVIALDAGHLCQNLYLACEAIGAGTCAIAAYDQDRADELLGVDGEEEFSVYLAPVGKVKQAGDAEPAR